MCIEGMLTIDTYGVRNTASLLLRKTLHSTTHLQQLQSQKLSLPHPRATRQIDHWTSKVITATLVRKELGHFRVGRRFGVKRDYAEVARCPAPRESIAFFIFFFILSHFPTFLIRPGNWLLSLFCL